MGIFERGFEFINADFVMMLAKTWGRELWLFRKHPNGEWCTVRKCTKEDLSKLAALIQHEHPSSILSLEV